MSDSVIGWPFGAADVQTPAYAAVIPVAVSNRKTILKPATLAGDATINLTIGQGITAGDQLLLEVKSDGTARATTLGTGFKAVAIAGVINKTKSVNFTYDGTYFVPDGAPVQID